MRIRLITLLFLCLVQVFLVLPVAAQEELLPWALRSHYSFSRDSMTFCLDEERALCQLKVGKEQVLANDIGFAIVLGDGTELRYNELGKAVTDRNVFPEGPLGPYAAYDVNFPVKDGLEVRYHLALAKERPISLTRLFVKNVGTEPVSIQTLRILEAPAGSITQLSPETRVHQRHGRLHGGAPIVDTQGDSFSMHYHDPKTNAGWLVGLSPRGHGESSMRFDAFGQGWQGQIESRFAPAATLAPGATMESAEIITVFGQQPISNLDIYYSWAYSSLERSLKAPRPIEAWVTVDDQGSFSDLLSMADHWKSARVDHALIPDGWELPLGSQQGGGRFPRSIGNAASELKKKNFKAGITFDPLAVKKGGKDWSSTAQDGQIWVNPLRPMGKTAIQARAKWFRNAGFSFLVPAPSAIPDAVLQQFGLSRGEANRLALEAIGEILPDTNLYPPSITQSVANRDTWLRAAASVARLSSYGVAVGPLRLDTNGIAKLDQEKMNALRLWPGPLELVGKAKSSGRSSIGETMGTKRLSGQPMDLEGGLPLHWQAAAHRKGSAEETIRFSGAAAVTP